MSSERASGQVRQQMRPQQRPQRIDCFTNRCSFNQPLHDTSRCISRTVTDSDHEPLQTAITNRYRQRSRTVTDSDHEPLQTAITNRYRQRSRTVTDSDHEPLQTAMTLSGSIPWSLPPVTSVTRRYALNEPVTPVLRQL